MLKPTIISQSELNRVDPTKECFIIKNVMPVSDCYEIVEYLTLFSKEHEENKKVHGENWHYYVRTNGNFFDSFLFNELSRIESKTLIKAYKKLFDFYNLFGEKTELNNFEEETKISDFYTQYRIINPLVFYYFVQKSQFGFHKHDSRNQKFQLLMNLTQPGVDYIGGETWVYMGADKPNIKNPHLIDECIVFGKEFEIGDVYSFPYHLWHKVEMPLQAKSDINARVSLLMPLGVRNSSDYPNENL
jgi:hypothetical protein